MAASKRQLIVVRHAKSDRSMAVPDHQRPLADRGRREAPAIGTWLRDHVGRLDVVVCSPAVRARQTWELAASALAQSPPVTYDKRVYAASADDLLEVVTELPDEVSAAALVGHNPGLEDLVALLTGVSAELKTSAIAVLSWSGSWADAAPGAAALDQQATPRP
jgi:phosphohistidine phosphatase